MEIFYLILGVLLFVGLVVIHEFGHFVVARRNGVEAEEFGIGFPPRAWSRKIKSKRGNYLFSINWLPLGGFVKLKGEHDSDTEKGTFGAASTWVKTKIMAAGILMNLLTALVLFTAVAWIGMPKILCNGQFTVASDTQIIRPADKEGVVLIGSVTPGSPADKAGLKAGMQVVSVAGAPISCPDQLPKATAANAGQMVAVAISDNGRQLTKQIRLNATSPQLGVGSYSGQEGLEFRRSTWSAPIVAVGVTWDIAKATFAGLNKALQGLGSIISGALTGNDEARRRGQTEASQQVAGPVGILAALQMGAREGFGFVLFIVAVISLSLAIMNVLPIPALDGGKLAITYISRLFGRNVSETVENYAYGISFLMLIGLMLLITFVDLRRFYGLF